MSDHEAGNRSPPSAGQDVAARPEHRSINRIPVRLAVSQRGRSAPLGNTRDISLHGTFIETRNPLPVGSVAPLSLGIEVGSSLELSAEVVRVTAEGMGLRFVELEPEARRRLRRWIVEHTSVEGSRRQAESLHQQAAHIEPIRSAPRITALLEEIRASGGPVLLIPADRLARESLRLVAHDERSVSFRAGSSTQLKAGDEVYALLTHSFVSYSFALRVLSVDDKAVRCARPDLVVFSERRSRDRVPVPPGSVVRWPAPWQAGRLIELPLLERSAEGFSFRAPVDGCLLVPGTPLEGASLFVEGQDEPVARAEVRHITRVEDVEGSWLRVGVALAGAPPRRENRGAERRKVKTPIGRFFTAIKDMFSLAVHRGRDKLGVSDGMARRVIVRPGSLPIVGLLDRTCPADSDERLSAPLFIIVPAFAGRKEQMAYLAGTLLEGFQRQNADIAVLRIDGTNNLGESGKDPECAGDGMHTLHFTLGGVIDDVQATLQWAKNNPYIDPTHIVVMSISIASVALRHILARPEGADATLWVSYMGAPEAVDSIRNFSGHVDLDAPFRQGQRLGVVSLGGSLVDGDRFFSDLHERGIAYLDVAKQEMARVRADVVWVRGRSDAYIDPQRVEALMNVPAAGRREITEVEGGHIPRSGGEALQQFVRITERVWEATQGTELPPFYPSVGRLVVKADAEWRAVRRGGLEDRSAWWQRYLLDEDGIGFDVLEHATEYHELMELQAGLTLHEGASREGPAQVLELGAGTGNLTRRLLERGARVHAVDFVPAALRHLEAKCVPFAARLSTAVADLDGSPFLAFRRFVAGDLPGPLALAERVPGIQRPLLDQLLVHHGEELMAALRGFELDLPALARRWNLSAKAAGLLWDMNLLARVCGARESASPEARRALLDGARRELRFLAPTVLDGPTGLDLPDHSVDAVALSLVLSYLDHPDDVLFEAQRVLKPGGTLVVSSLVTDAESSKLYLGVIRRLESLPAQELPPGVEPEVARARLIAAARRFASQGGELLRLEEEGLFRFYDGSALVERVARRGFVGARIHPSFGTPPQAAVVSCMKR